MKGARVRALSAHSALLKYKRFPPVILSTIEEYSLAYSVTINEDAYFEALEIVDVLMTEVGIQALELTASVDVIDEERATSYIEDGLIVYTSGDEIYVTEDAEEEEVGHVEYYEVSGGCVCNGCGEFFSNEVANYAVTGIL